MTGEWRPAQLAVLASIAKHQGANQDYFEEAERILDLVSRAYYLWLQQPAQDQRKLLNRLLSNRILDARSPTITKQKALLRFCRRASLFNLAPRPGFEPGTHWLTASRSTS